MLESVLQEADLCCLHAVLVSHITDEAYRSIENGSAENFPPDIQASYILSWFWWASQNKNGNLYSFSQGPVVSSLE